MRSFFICSFALLSLLTIGWGVVDGSKVILENNEYQGLILAIEDNLPSEKCQQILSGLELLIRSASTKVFQTTRKRAFFKSVTVVVPASWSSSTCTPLQRHIQPSSGESYSNADIRITKGRHPNFGPKPWTLQSRGCAQPGDYISLGYEFLLTNDTEVNGRLLAHSWLKYRYGVFEEVGSSDDINSPLAYRDDDGQWAPTTCANVPLLRQPLCSREKATCNEEVSSVKDLYSLSSSFIAFPEEVKATELCDEATHNSKAPTPHNLLCGAKSVWEVLRASPDFQNNRNVEGRARPGEVVISYVRQTNPRMVLLVEDTNIMNVQKRWSFMRKAVRKLVSYDIPDGFSVGLVVFDSTAQTKYPLKPLTDDSNRYNLGSSLPRNPSRVDKHRRCVFCGIENSVKMLRENGGTASGHIVLMLAGSGRVDPTELERIEQLLDSTGIILHVIIYPFTEKFPEPVGGIELLASKSQGLSFTIPDEGIGADSKIVMYYNLLDALFHTLGAAAGDNVLPVKVHSAEHNGGLTNSEGSFWVDPGLGSNTVFAVFYYDVAHVGDSIHLTSPEGQVIDTGNMQFEDSNMNMVSIRLRDDQESPGLWHYRLENRADSHQALFVQVTSKPQRHLDSAKVRVRSWMSHPVGEVNRTDTSNPFAIFVEIRVDLAPISGAKATAVLTRLGFHTNGTVHDPITLQLFDNGLLSPDIKRNDGVYSRFAQGLPTGKYSVVVNTVGQVGEHKFTRQIRLGIINVMGEAPAVDKIPPARITDLRVALLPDTGGTLSFVWTSTGDDRDYGQADSYNVLVSNSFDELRDLIGEELEGWPKPLPSLSIQQHTLSWQEFNTLKYLALYAVDQSGNRGELSNIVEIYVPSISTTGASAIVTSVPGPVDLLSIDAEGSLVFGESNTKQLAVVLGCIGGLVLVIIAIICYCSAYKRNKKADPEKGHDSRDGFSVTVTVGSKTTDFEEKKNGFKKDYLQPINSWSPSELLGSHDKRDSISGRSDNNSDHSGSTKKSYGESSEPPQYYQHSNPYPYDPTGYNDVYPISTDGYPSPVDAYPSQSSYYHSDGMSLSPDMRGYAGYQPSNSFLSESCDVLPGTQGPPGYSPYDAAYRGTKVPPPIPPKPKVAYTPEPYPMEGPDAGTNSSNTSISSEKRIRNVTMV